MRYNLCIDKIMNTETDGHIDRQGRQEEKSRGRERDGEMILRVRYLQKTESGRTEVKTKI